MTQPADATKVADDAPPYPLPFPPPSLHPVSARIVPGALFLGAIGLNLLGTTTLGSLLLLSVPLLILFWPRERWAMGLRVRDDDLLIGRSLIQGSRRVAYADIQKVELRWRLESFGFLHLTLRGEPPEEIVVSLGGPFTDLEKKTVAWIQARAATAVFE